METGQFNIEFRKNEHNITNVLDKLDALQLSVLSEQRHHDRFPYRDNQSVLYIMQPGSSSYLQYCTPTRNISRSGVGFLHNWFLHINTICKISLQQLNGEWNMLKGRIVHCNCLEESLYVVGVELTEEIDPVDYCKAQ